MGCLLRKESFSGLIINVHLKLSQLSQT